MNNLADNNGDVTRSLPHAVGPEKSILSSCFQEPNEFVPQIVELGFTEDHFYLPSHSVVFGELLRRFNAGEQIELVSFVQGLLDCGKLKRVGGPAAIADIYNYAPTPLTFGFHAEMVRQKYVLREIIKASTEAISDSYDGPERAEDVIDALESRLSHVREDSSTRNTLRKASEDINRIADEFRQRIEGKQQEKGIATGFHDLDRMLGGLKPGNTYVVAARPSVGKTSFLLNMAEHVAIDAKGHALIFSLEMPRKQVVERIVYSMARLRHDAGQGTDKGDLLRFQHAARSVNDAELWIDDRAGLTLQEIRAKARRLHRKAPLAFLGVDYLQLVRCRSKQAQNSREREVAEVSAGFKELAKELGLPIVILAQLNRDVEKRKGKPRMSDLRESGSIEQDADCVAFLHREDYARDEEEKTFDGRAELIVAKNRNGETGVVPLTFLPEFMRFESRAYDFQEKTRSRYSTD